MIRRLASSFLVSATVMVQLLAGAFAQAVPVATSDAGCVGDGPAHSAAAAAFEQPLFDFLRPPK